MNTYHILRIKVSKGLGIIFKARMFVDKKCFRNLYYYFVHPYLIYSIETWVSASKIHLHPLRLTQKKVVRIITFSYYFVHIQPLILSLSILLLDKLFVNQIGIVMYNYCNGLHPDVMNRLYAKKITILIHITLEETIYLEYREAMSIL